MRHRIGFLAQSSVHGDFGGVLKIPKLLKGSFWDALEMFEGC